MGSIGLETAIKNKARQFGYDLCGIIKAEPLPEHIAHLDERVGCFPESAHLYEGLYENAYPEKTVEWAKSIIVCVRRYGRYKIPAEAVKYIGKYYLFDHRLEYAKEYSDWQAFEHFLKETGLLIHKSSTAARWAAVKAGLGAFGNNNFLYTRFGSWVWIDTWIVDKDLDYDEPVKEKVVCPPNCNKCVKACPTKALSGPLMMDRGKCIAHLSYYSTLPVPEDLREQLGTWLYGCDVCQEVCPMNKGKLEESENFPKLDQLAEYLTPERIVEMDEDIFLSVIQPRFSYIGKNGLWLWKCNALRAMANSRDEKYQPYILKACDNENENVRTMAVWARN